MFFQSAKRFAAVTFASVLAFSLAAPLFVVEAQAAPFPIATGFAKNTSVEGAGLPLTEVRYRRGGGRRVYGHRRGYGIGGGALALGVLGLGIAAIAAQERSDRRQERVYYNPGYNSGYYPQPVYQPDTYYQPEPEYVQPAPVYTSRPYYGHRQVYVQPPQPGFRPLSSFAGQPRPAYFNHPQGGYPRHHRHGFEERGFNR